MHEVWDGAHESDEDVSFVPDEVASFLFCFVLRAVVLFGLLL